MKPLITVLEPLDRRDYEDSSSGVMLLLIISVVFALFILPRLCNKKSVLVVVAEKFNSFKESFLNTTVVAPGTSRAIIKDSLDESMKPYAGALYGN